MKRFLLFLSAICICTIAFADTINLTWKNGDTTYDTTTCTVGGDLILPTPPTKTGYNFIGWEVKAAKELQYVTFQAASYIDTGIKFDSDEIEIETKFSNKSNTHTVFGIEGTCISNTSNNFSNDTLSLYVWQSNSQYSLYAGTYRNLYIKVSAGSTNECKFYVNKNSRTLTETVNGTVASVTLSGTINSTQNIRIGSLNTQGSYCGFTGNMYYFRIKKDGILVLDLIPAKDPDGVVCFYDKVSKTFFYNQYGADLIAGPEVE